MKQRDKQFTTIGSYDADHSELAIIQPHLIFRVSYFFIEHWLPRLGPAYAWFVIALQQSCWWGQHRRSTGQISQRQLGYYCGLERETINRLIRPVREYREKKAAVAPDLAWFIRGIKSSSKEERQVGNYYNILLNDPLTPTLAAGLEVTLQAARQEAQEASLALTDAAKQAVSKLLIQEPAMLINGLNKLGAAQIPFPDPITASQMVAKVFELSKKEQGVGIPLSYHLLQPDDVYLGTQYFRKEWVPYLGPTLAWLITLLRRYCFEDKTATVVRNDFSFTTTALAAQMGITAKTLENQLKQVELIAPFFGELKIKGGNISGKIHVKKEPLTDGGQQCLHIVQEQADVEGVPAEPPCEQTPPSPVEPKGKNVTPQARRKGKNVTPPLNAKKKDHTPALSQGKNVTHDSALSVSTKEESASHHQHKAAGDGDYTNLPLFQVLLPNHAESKPLHDEPSPDQPPLHELTGRRQTANGTAGLSDESKSLNQPSHQDAFDRPVEPEGPDQVDIFAALAKIKDKRGRVTLLIRLLNPYLSPGSAIDRQRVGRLVKRAGSGPKGALVVAEAILNWQKKRATLDELLTWLEHKFSGISVIENDLLSLQTTPTQEKKKPASLNSVVRGENNLTEKQVLDYLDELGIHEPYRSRLAIQPRLAQPLYLEKWKTYFLDQKTYGTGWLIRQLEGEVPAPETKTESQQTSVNTTANETPVPSLSPLELKWEEFQNRLRIVMTRDTFNNHFQLAQLINCENNILTVGIKTPVSLELVENRLRILLRNHARHVFENPALEIQFQLLDIEPLAE